MKANSASTVGSNLAEMASRSAALASYRQLLRAQRKSFKCAHACAPRLYLCNVRTRSA